MRILPFSMGLNSSFSLVRELKTAKGIFSQPIVPAKRLKKACPAFPEKKACKKLIKTKTGKCCFHGDHFNAQGRREGRQGKRPRREKLFCRAHKPRAIACTHG